MIDYRSGSKQNNNTRGLKYQWTLVYSGVFDRKILIIS